MTKIKIANCGVEGGGCTIYGRQADDGFWFFWHEGSSMWLDENGDDIWRPWTSAVVDDVIEAFPDGWWTMNISSVHPDFVVQLYQEYQKYRGMRGWRGCTF